MTHYKKYVLLQRFFCDRCKNRHYMSPITMFFQTAAIGIIFCSILQRQDIKLPQYICFSGGNLDIVALQKPAAINTSFCTNTMAAIKKNVAICELQRCLYDHRNRDSFLQQFFLVIVVGWTATINLLTLSLNLPSVFFFFFGFPFLPKTLYLFISFTVSLSNSSKTQNPSSLSLSSSHSPSQTQNPTTATTFTTTPPPPPNHVVGATQQPQSTSSLPPHFNPPHKFFFIFLFFIIYVQCVMLSVFLFNVLSLFLLFVW